MINILIVNVAKKEPKVGEVDGVQLEIIFVDEGLCCRLHGATIEIPMVKNCQIHGNSGIYIDESEKEVYED